MKKRKDKIVTDDTATLSDDIVITDATIAAAIEESINNYKHYLGYVYECPDKITLGRYTCPLCLIYNMGLKCSGCPVQIDTGSLYCETTPFEKIQKTLNEMVLAHPGFKFTSRKMNDLKTELYDAMENEIEYLEQLLVKFKSMHNMNSETIK